MIRSRFHRSGFGLVEMLVAMAILGIVLAALLALTSGTTRFTLISTIATDAARDLSDASGYLGDAFRSSSWAATGISVALVGSGTFTCEVNTCLALRSPTFDAITGDPDGDVLSVYRVVRRSDIPVAWRADAPHTGDNTTSHALVRYVSEPGILAVAVVPSLVLDNVVLADTSLQFDSGTGSLEISLRVGRSVRGGTTFFPGDGSLETLVVQRN